MKIYAVLSLAVIIVMAADVATGSFGALYRGEFKSSIMRRGWWRKAAEVSSLFGLIGCEAVARLAGVDLALPFGFIGGAAYITAMEGASIVENIYSLNNGKESGKDGNSEES